MGKEVTHARFSPSKLEELEQCPKFSRKPMEDAADEGTMLHKSFETGDMTGLDEEQRTAVELAAGYRDSVAAGFKILLSDEREVYLELPELTYGYADQVLIGTDADGKRCAAVMDAKFGRKGATRAEENFQVHCYVAGLFIREELRGTPLAYATGHIVAPRVYASPYGVRFEPDLVETTKQRVSKLYEKLNHPFAPPQAHEDLCGMCKWAAECPALHQTVAVMAKGVGLPAPAVFSPEAIVEPRDRTIAMMLVKALGNWVDQVKDNNTAYVAEQGGEIPGFKLIRRSTGTRVPVESVGVALSRLINQGYSLERLIPGLRISIPELAEAEADRNGTTVEEERQTIITAIGDVAITGATTFLQMVKKFDFAGLLAAPEVPKLTGGDTQPAND